MLKGFVWLCCWWHNIIFLQKHLFFFYHLVPSLSPSLPPEGRNLDHRRWCIRLLITTSPWLTPAYFGPSVISVYEMGTRIPWHRTVELPIYGKRAKKYKFRHHTATSRWALPLVRQESQKPRYEKPKVESNWLSPQVSDLFMSDTIAVYFFNSSRILRRGEIVRQRSCELGCCMEFVHIWIGIFASCYSAKGVTGSQW